MSTNIHIAFLLSHSLTLMDNTSDQTISSVFLSITVVCLFVSCRYLHLSHRKGDANWIFYLKGRLNTDTSPQNFWTNFLENDLTEKLKKSAVANVIAIALPLCFSCFVLLRRFRGNLTKPFYFYLPRTCGSPGDTPWIISRTVRVEHFFGSSQVG